MGIMLCIEAGGASRNRRILRAAWRMRSRPVENGVVDSHVELTESLKQIQRAA